jgi:hypothetical protein
VLVKPDAISLNVRVDVAHVGVSIEGKMLKMTRLPLMSALPISLKVPVVSANFGRRDPTFGSLPLTETLLPPSVTEDFAATFFFAVFFEAFFEAFFADFLTAFFTVFLAAFFVAFLVFFFAAMGFSLFEVV